MGAPFENRIARELMLTKSSKSLVIETPPDQIEAGRRVLIAASVRIFWTSLLFGIPAVAALLLLLQQWQGGPLAARYYGILLVPCLFPLGALYFIVVSFVPRRLILDERGVSLRIGPLVRRIGWKRLHATGFLHDPRHPAHPIFVAESFGGEKIRLDVDASAVDTIVRYIEAHYRGRVRTKG